MAFFTRFDITKYPALFEIKNLEKKRYLIDVSKYFNQDSPGFNVIRPSLKKKYKIGNVDSKRSFINSSKSYPKNTEISPLPTCAK